MLSQLPQWTLDPKTTYLNHGSFGPSPDAVRKHQRDLQAECDAQPMNFYLRRLEPLWFASRERLAAFLQCDATSLVFTENATQGMNHLAHFFPLQEGDEVLLNDHEYGVVKQIWKRRCQQSKAVYREMTLPMPIASAEEMIDAFDKSITSRTRLVIVSHITSPTAITLPVESIIQRCKQRGVAICVDGPHAPLQIPLAIDALGCDFYIASCHKWLCAPLGTGFTYVSKAWQDLAADPLAVSWGRLPPAPLEHWSHHHLWCGTRDYSGYLSVGRAIETMEQADVNAIRDRNHQLARFAREQLLKALHTEALVPDDPSWYRMMTSVWLPEGDHATLQRRLWERHAIEVPIVHFAGRYLIRVSCHLYNDEEDIQKLLFALKAELSLA